MGSRGQAKEREIKSRGDSSESAALEQNQVNFSLMAGGPFISFLCSAGSSNICCSRCGFN